MTNPKQHHFIPKAYLRFFLKDQQKSELISVTDLKKRKHYQTNIKNIGGERYFNRAKVDGKDSDELEVILSKFETQIPSALENVPHNATFFKSNSFNVILNLIALIYSRNPSLRSSLECFIGKISERFLELHARHNPKTTGTIENNASYKDFINKKRYKIVVPKEMMIPLEFEFLDSFISQLSKLGWTLIISEKSNGPFITSESPVVITWKNPEMIPTFFRNSPGIGCIGTQIQFPITKEIAIVGEIEARDSIIKVNREWVARFNTNTMSFSKRLFSPDFNYHFINNEGTLSEGNDVFRE